MALQLNYSKTIPMFDGAVTLPSAYWKVEEVVSTKESASFTVSISGNNGIVEHKRYVFTPNLDGDNFIKQAYEHLKTLPEFADATDV